MSFREDYEYHVMNNNSGRLVYSSHAMKDAEGRASTYTANSGYAHTVLRAERTFFPVKSVESCKGTLEMQG